ncbi:hypothetical protein [Streptomyces fragilis]|uniref:Lipoprotein n=1 Tax=Streptomyces fragilis TaxID=67301 RepID=A0ABV2YIL3_9ACTN|nr:hypothetical protein [Streptomyces fragilis]
MRRRAARALLLGVIPAALIAGCGIRATEVPVDSGPAPSRKPCPVSDPSPVPSNDARVPVRVYLLCAGQLTLVERTVGLPGNTEGASRRTLVAQGLLDELARPPLPGEAADGYRTLVPFGTGVQGHRRGDPAEAFRLNVRPDRLRDGALAQIVCTFAESAATQGAGSVILGGPKGDLTRYECPPDVRNHPTATPVPSATAAPAQ